ncbi:fungal-specific transcription factor domain-containing protein [Aspergillus crustosus]
MPVRDAVRSRLQRWRSLTTSEPRAWLYRQSSFPSTLPTSELRTSPSYAQMQSSRLNKSCDQCRNRKVRCIVPPAPPEGAVACAHCIKRNETCQFSNLKRRLRPKGSPAPQNVSSTDTSSAQPYSDLFIDRLIRNPSESAVLVDDSSVLMAHDDRVPSSGLAFFSDKRVDSLVKRLGDTHVRELVHQIDLTIKTRLLARPGKTISLYSLAKVQTEPVIEREAAAHIQRYFEILHPIYPFLDRGSFEAKAKGPNLAQILETDYAFSGLYYAILALGCQYNGLSSFIPDNSHAWKLFQISLSRLDRILMTSESLPNLQALTAMAIFATNTFSLQLDQTLISEAARMVIALRYHKSAVDEDSTLCHRIFWVIYHLEKRYCFQARSSSLIADYDIGCPLPTAPESVVGEYNWLISSVRYGRILSVAYASLFSTSASTRSDDTILNAIDHIHGLLEDWRLSIPVEFRPKEPLQRHRLIDGVSKEIALRTHYYYYQLVIALGRLTLHVSRNIARSENSMRALLNTAREVINLTRYIDVEPYTPVFILAIIPLSALFILFDFVVHHPTDSDIRGCLTLLDIIAGHFSQLDHASNGAIQSSYLSGFSHMARQHVQSVQKRPVVHDAPSHEIFAAQLLAADTSVTSLDNPLSQAGQLNDPTLMEGIDYSDLDNFYFLTPDSDLWSTGLPSLDEFDPREYYGSIFL